MADNLAGTFGAALVHIDDFFLPPELRTETRLSEPGGNVHYERFRSEVVDKLRLNEPFSYRRFECSTMSFADYVAVDAAPVIIVEGSYSLHPYFGDYADLKIFKDVGPDVQWQRILERNGLPQAESFRTKWIPMEEKYFEYYKIREAADIIL